MSLFPKMRSDSKKEEEGQGGDVEEDSKASTIIIYVLWGITLILTGFTLRRHYMRWRAAAYTRVIEYGSRRTPMSAEERQASATASATAATAATATTAATAGGNDAANGTSDAVGVSIAVRNEVVSPVHRGEEGSDDLLAARSAVDGGATREARGPSPGGE